MVFKGAMGTKEIWRYRMKNVRTANGRVIDMSALAKAHEQDRAVGNIPMNARGDRLDPSGNVVATVQKIARAQHNLATAPEKRKLSDVPGNKKTKKRGTKVEKLPEGLDLDDHPVKDSEFVVNSVEKERDDGTKYAEIEYKDGSMKTVELEN